MAEDKLSFLSCRRLIASFLEQHRDLPDLKKRDKVTPSFQKKIKKLVTNALFGEQRQWWNYYPRSYFSAREEGASGKI